jgi:uncharacterized protein YlxP (DUF503 family)
MSTLKERRKIAQSARDQIKSSYNATVKLIYSEDTSSFELYIIMLGETEDYLRKCLHGIEGILESSGELDYKVNLDFDIWAD